MHREWGSWVHRRVSDPDFPVHHVHLGAYLQATNSPARYPSHDGCVQ